MKIGVVGKGGVGKTTITSLLAEAYARQGRRVIAVDTDSNPNLGLSLGLSFAETESVPVLPRSVMVGAGGDVTADRLISDYGRPTPASVTLLSAIRVNEAGAGCTCAGHATVRSLLGQVLDDQADVTIVDMEAGLEHLSRSGGTLAAADVLVVVMEPSRKAVLTAARTAVLAEELGIPRTYGVGNKAHLPADAEFFTERCAEMGVTLAGVLPHEPDVAAADRAGGALAAGRGDALRAAVDQLAAFLDSTKIG
ncbi:MAG: nucleotide-binding protein [Acidimicrobiales bacterium]